jgi:DNA-binding transcriptional regulator GbsR (MarR family)
MTKNSPTDSHLRFVDYFGDLGARWGLPVEACRVHAHLYLTVRPSDENEILAALSIEKTVLSDALSFLVDYGLVSHGGPGSWRTSSDPWEMLVRGLDERRKRELPLALSTLQRCHTDALAERRSAEQIGKMLRLVEDLAAIDARTRNLSPVLLRGIVGASGRAARLLDRVFGPEQGRRT